MNTHTATRSMRPTVLRGAGATDAAAAVATTSTIGPDGAMQIAVHATDFELTEALRAHLLYRLNFALWRFQDRIVRVTVGLSDLSGLLGSIDKVCRLRIRLRGMPDILIEDIEADLYVAISRAADRAGRTMGRQLERARGDCETGVGAGMMVTVFQRAGARPLPDEPHEGSVHIAMLDRLQQPRAVDRVEEPSNVAVERPAHRLTEQPGTAHPGGRAGGFRVAIRTRSPASPVTVVHGRGAGHGAEAERRSNAAGDAERRTPTAAAGSEACASPRSGQIRIAVPERGRSGRDLRDS